MHRNDKLFEKFLERSTKTTKSLPRILFAPFPFPRIQTILFSHVSRAIHSTVSRNERSRHEVRWGNSDGGEQSQVRRGRCFRVLDRWYQASRRFGQRSRGGRGPRVQTRIGGHLHGLVGTCGRWEKFGGTWKTGKGGARTWHRDGTSTKMERARLKTRWNVSFNSDERELTSGDDLALSRFRHGSRVSNYSKR